MAEPARPSQRSVLSIPDREHVGLTTYDAKSPDTSFPPIEPLRPPKGAPNVLIVMLDDAGFGSSSAFGGPCQTPTFEFNGRVQWVELDLGDEDADHLIGPKERLRIAMARQ